MPIPKVVRIVPLALAVAACGNDPAASPPSPEATHAGHAPLGVVQTVAVSPGEHDRFFTAAFDAGNRLYAGGWPTAPTSSWPSPASTPTAPSTGASAPPARHV